MTVQNATAANSEGVRPLRVLLVTPVPPPEHGGIINWTRVVTLGLKHEARLEMSFVDTARRSRGIPGFPRLSRLLFGSAQAFRDTWRTYRHLRRWRPDVLHLNTSAGLATPKDIMILALAKRLGVASVSHYHMQRPPKDIVHHRWQWRLLRYGMSLATAVVTLDAQSEALVKAALPGKKVVTLPTMVEIDVIDAIRRRYECSPLGPSAAARVNFLGFVCAHKGVGDLVEACVRVPEPSLVLDLVGPVPPAYQRQLQAVAARKDGGRWLRFHGGLPHERALTQIMAADLFVLPSHGESAPAVILEAMGCEKPVLGTSVGAIPEMLDIGGPQECGVCVPPGDVDALAGAIARLLSDPQKRRELGRKGRERAEASYAVPVGCRQLLELWRAVAS